MVKIRMGFWLLPLFTGLAFVFAAGLQTPLLWFLFYLGLACTVLTVVYSLRKWGSLAITRTFDIRQSTLEAGASLNVVLRTRVHGWLPWPWLEISDDLPRSLTRRTKYSAEATLFWLRKGLLRRAAYRIPDLVRGVHTWHTLRYRSGDLLGFLTYESQLAKPAQLVVYPRTIALPPFQFFPRRTEGSVLSRKTYNLSQTQLVGIRDYQPGDRLSLIDWKSTAKTGSLLSKEFEPLLMSFSLIILDCFVGAWDRGYDPAFEEAVTITASLAKTAVSAKVPIRFLSNFSKQWGQIAVASWAEYYNLLRHLAAIDADGEESIAPLLYKELFLRNNNIVLVSSRQGSKQRQLLEQIAVRGNSVIAIFVDTESESVVSPRRFGAYSELLVKKAEDLLLTAERSAK